MDTITSPHQIEDADQTASHGRTYSGRQFSFKDGVFRILNEDNELMPVTATIEVNIDGREAFENLRKPIEP